MSIFIHHAILVTGSLENVEKAHTIAETIFRNAFRDNIFTNGDMVSNILCSNLNGIATFMIAPDGSKEYLHPSNQGNTARKNFMAWMSKNSSCYCIEVEYGETEPKILQ